MTYGRTRDQLFLETKVEVAAIIAINLICFKPTGFEGWLKGERGLVRWSI
jgi:hypothetical protein